jgi:hypothetical protein
VSCGETEECHDGACQPTGCALPCNPAQVCQGGTCVPDPCIGVTCGVGEACDSTTGECGPDPCTGITCPGDDVCEDGECVDPPAPVGPDAGVEPGVYATGGGCDVGGGGGGAGAVWLVLLIPLVAWRPRLALLALVFLIGGCDVEPFFFDRDGGAGGADAAVIDGGGGVDAPTGIDAGPDAGCVIGAEEICNGVDDDCDLGIDEGFDFQTDGRHCGGCDISCAKAGAQTQCQLGDCAITDCFPGFVDLDGDTAGPFDASNGCEYMCFVSNGGVEACDTLDNDCDGDVDEDTSFDDDVMNCGECGRVCGFFQATPHCAGGLCLFDPAVDCLPGFHDDNGDQTDGCEYACTVTNGGVEACDGVDNNCDGVVDESFDLGTNPLNCGVCGRVCSFPNAVASCDMGTCLFDPATDCDAGFHDNNGNQLDGCEYGCTEANGGVEICDALDDDCDGEIDETADIVVNDPTIGVTCGTTDVGECLLGVTVCAAGGAVCSGSIEPRAENCDGLDDDCDGVADDPGDLIDVGAVCLPPVGQCTAGLTVCTGGALDCVRAVGPSAETCDGVDNDCDGAADDSPVDAGLPCGGGAVNGGTSQCVQGTTACAGGVLSCPGQVGPSAETCDGVDNDCDGAVDDAALLVGSVCGSDIGECTAGTYVCTAGALVCSGGTGPAAEICDGADNDCSGLPDDNLSDPSLGLPCGMTDVGSCQLGVTVCSSGGVVCSGEIGPSGETCNNADDDCDGAVDDGISEPCYSGPAGTQGIGVCVAGTRTCTAGAFGSCAGEVLPQSESCNGIDDDCDTVADEAAGGGPLTQSCYTGPGGTLGVGVCAAGVETCSGGAFGSCAGETLPSAEICFNAVDEDCDANVTSASEGCFTALASELRVDSITGAGLASAAGAHHSFDADVAATGASNVYVAFSDSRQTSGATPRNIARVFLARSTDGGATFSSPLTVVSDAVNRCDTDGNGSADGLCAATAPRVLASGTTVVVTYIQFRGNQTRDIMVAVSTDSGATFAAPTRMDANVDIGDSFHFDVAMVLSGTLKFAVAWEEMDTATVPALPRRVKVRRTANVAVAAPTFAAEQVANRGPGATPIAGRPKLAYGNSDRLLVTWREKRVGTTMDVYANFWDDAAGTINATDVRLDTDSGSGLDDVPVIARLGAEVYVAWEEVRSDGRGDIVFVRSTNNGAAFGAEQVIDDPAVELSSSGLPQIAAVAIGGENRVYVSWIDDRDGLEVFVARSTNGGGSFGAPARASSVTNPTPGISGQHRILADASGRIAISFTSTRSGSEDVFVAFSLDAGVTWQPTDVRADGGGAGTGASVDPVIALRSTGGVHVTWIDYRTNGFRGDVYFRSVGP